MAIGVILLVPTRACGLEPRIERKARMSVASAALVSCVRYQGHVRTAGGHTRWGPYN
jgi:hypothetical protein